MIRLPAYVLVAGLLLWPCVVPAGRAAAQTTPPATTTSAAPATATDPDTVQSARRDNAQRLVVPVAVNGAAAEPFVVDTGSERTIVARDLAERLALPAGVPVRISGVAGSLATPTAKVTQLALPEMTLEGSSAPLLERDAMGAAGLIGIDSLQKSEILFDFEKNSLAIRKASRHVPAPRSQDENEIIVTARRKAGRMILTHAYIDGVRTDVVIDTGAEYCVGNLALLAALRKKGRIGESHTGMLHGVTGHVLAAEVAVMKRLDVGGVTLTELPVAFAASPAFAAIDLEEKPALFLGMNAMKVFKRVSIDFANKRVTFRLPGARTGDRPRYAALEQ